jgi:hypothetical protein
MTIKFDKKFYSLKAVKSAVKKYRNFADFGLKQKKNRIEVNLKNIDKDVSNVIKDEFCNYVLYSMKILS